MYPARLGLLASGLAAVVLAFVCTGPPVDSVALGSVLFILGLVLVGVAEAYAMRRRQREWLAKTWGTFENFRASVDFVALRELKYRRGNFAVARRLKKQYPHLAPELAQALINEL